MPRLECVDLSSNNVGVEYRSLYNAGVRYAWIRVNDLDMPDHIDRAHNQHREACQAVGIKCFPYWVAHPSLNPNTEGGIARQHAHSGEWDTLPGTEEVPWALDWEEAGLTLSWAQRFGQPPVLYRSLSRENVFPDAKQWVADWDVASPPTVKHLVAWQYTDHLHGYATGPLDASEVYFHVPPIHHDPSHTDTFHAKVLHRLHVIHQLEVEIARKVGVSTTVLDASLALFDAPPEGDPPPPGGVPAAGDSGASATSPNAAPDVGATTGGGA